MGWASRKTEAKRCQLVGSLSGAVVVALVWWGFGISRGRLEGRCGGLEGRTAVIVAIFCLDVDLSVRLRLRLSDLQVL